MPKPVHRHVIHWVTLASVLGHVFCCGLPLAVSLIGLLAGVGTLSVMVPGLETLHAGLHHYEWPLIVFSAVMVALGWVFHFLGRKVDCHDSGCHHPPCEPSKDRTSMLLVLATVIFIANICAVVLPHAVPVSALSDPKTYLKTHRVNSDE